MTTPSRIKEILREMEQDPELAQALRERVLGQEISMLPSAVAQNQSLIIRLMERQIQLSEATVTAMDTVLSAIQRTGERTATAVEALNLTVAGVEFEISELKEESQKTRESLTQVLTDVRRIDGRMDRGFGANYEAKVSQNVRSILGQQAGVRSAKVLKGPNLRNDPDFDQLVENAENSGVITENESDELLLLDLIVSGTRTGTPDRLYAGIEVSITANNDDMNRAADRVEILRKVTGGPVLAAVIAVRVETPQRELAATRGVTVAVHPE